MDRFEELLARQVTNQQNNNTKVLNNGRTWFTYPTPGQPNSTEPFINSPEGTFQPTLDKDTPYPSDDDLDGVISESRKAEYDTRYKPYFSRRYLKKLYSALFEQIKNTQGENK